MSEEKPSKPRRPLLRYVIILAIAAAAFWVVHPPLAGWAIRKGLVAAASSNGFDLEIDSVQARLGSALRLQGVRLKGKNATEVEISDLAVVPSNPLTWFAKSTRWIDRVGVTGLQAFVDARDFPPAETPAKRTKPLDLRFLPREIGVDDASGEFVNEGQQFVMRDLTLSLTERGGGRLRLGELAARGSGWSKSLSKVHAITGWNAGVLSLGDLELQTGVIIESFSANLVHESGTAMSFRAGIFGGSLRGDITAGAKIDAALWASQIPLAPLPGLAGSAERVGGRLVEGRLTFRGDPARLSDAEASVRLVAQNFRWNDRGWESLELGASLIHRRLVVTDFDLRQKQNLVNFNGEISIADGWSQISKSPFLLNVKADIKELGALGGLVGAPFDELSGRMSASGSVSGREGALEGFLSLESSGIEFRSLPIHALRLEAVFKKSEVEIAHLAVYSDKDFVLGKGTVGIAQPHIYSAEVNARIADIAKYLGPFRSPAADIVYSGALDLKWQGDGTFKAHSGAFDVKLRELVAEPAPGGLSGQFTGTYSPQNLYFSNFSIENGPMRLGTRATFAKSGITLKDLELRGANRPLLEGTAFFPMNIFSVLGGTDWRAAIDPAAESYFRVVAPKDLALGDLLKLTGQDIPLQGVVRGNLEGGGPLSRLRAQGALSAAGLRYGTGSSPDSDLQLRVNAADGNATVSGTLATRGFRPLTVDGRMPFGLVRTPSGDWRWINPAGAFEARLDFPRTDLSVFRPFLPTARRIAGEISGNISANGTFSAPVATGRLDLRNGALELSTRTPAITNLNAGIAFNGTGATIETFRGDIGAGPLSIAGNVTFAGPACDLKIRGEKILLYRDAGMRLRANVDLAIQGEGSKGRIAGSVRLVDGRIYRRIEVTPLIVPAPGQAPMNISPPIPPGTVPAPFASWTADVKLVNETPFLLKGNIADGEIVPNLTLTGTLGNLVPIGRISLQQVRAFLPFTTMTIPDGRIDFLPDAPWIPMLDIRGTAQMPDYDIQAYAFGPLNENKLILRSEPPLPQETLVLLLTTGIAPGVTTGRGFSDAAIGQGGLFLLRTMAREFNLPGIDTDALINRLNISATPANSAREQTTLRGTFQLWRDLDLLTARDGYGFYQGGLTYTWRFR